VSPLEVASLASPDASVLHPKCFLHPGERAFRSCDGETRSGSRRTRATSVDVVRRDELLGFVKCCASSSAPSRHSYPPSKIRRRCQGEIDESREGVAAELDRVFAFLRAGLDALRTAGRWLSTGRTRPVGMMRARARLTTLRK
jgi:hypothetical protein